MLLLAFEANSALSQNYNFVCVLAHCVLLLLENWKTNFDINKPQGSKAFPASLFTFTVCILLSPPNLHPHNLPTYLCTIKKKLIDQYFFQIARNVLPTYLNTYYIVWFEKKIHPLYRTGKTKECLRKNYNTKVSIANFSTPNTVFIYTKL